MGDNIIDNRRSIRQRMDFTALHKTKLLDTVVTTSDVVRLDIVAEILTVDLGTMTAHIDGSIDGITYFSLVVGATGRNTYGKAVGNHLVKWVKITCTAGTDKATILAV
jgi:hypothetical protein